MTARPSVNEIPTLLFITAHLEIADFGSDVCILKLYANVFIFQLYSSYFQSFLQPENCLEINFWLKILDIYFYVCFFHCLYVG